MDVSKKQENRIMVDSSSIIITVTFNSLLSGCGLPSPPVVLHGPVGRVPDSFGGIFTPVGGQNHPRTIAGFKSSRSHPSKLHFRPEVHVNLCLPVISFCFRKSISSGVSESKYRKQKTFNIFRSILGLVIV